MATKPAAQRTDWMDASGLVYILKLFRMAIDPSKLLLALFGLFATIIVGSTMDRLWLAADWGIAPEALASHVGLSAPPTADVKCSAGVFEVFRHHQVDCIRDAIESVRHGRFIGDVYAGRPLAGLQSHGDHAVRGIFTNIVLMVRGVVWMFTAHWFYAILFFLLFVMIWAYAGGSICRNAGLQFARDRNTSALESLRFVQRKAVGGYFTAPIIPTAMIVGVAILLMLGGVILAIPWLGDIIGSLFFIFALLGGLLIAVLSVGFIGAGPMFWPTLAVEDSDPFDAVARSYSYLFARPLRLLWYTFLTIVFGSFCWLTVAFIAWVTAAATHLFVGIGSGIFGGVNEAPNKLTALWSPPTFESLVAIPSDVSGINTVGAYIIGFWSILLLGVVWSFLVSFYFSGSTVIYFLMRRDVDYVDIAEIYTDPDDDEAMNPPAESSDSSDSESSGD